MREKGQLPYPYDPNTGKAMSSRSASAPPATAGWQKGKGKAKGGKGKGKGGKGKKGKSRSASPAADNSLKQIPCKFKTLGLPCRMDPCPFCHTQKVIAAAKKEGEYEDDPVAKS